MCVCKVLRREGGEGRRRRMRKWMFKAEKKKCNLGMRTRAKTYAKEEAEKKLKSPEPSIQQPVELQ